jgi:hypothetical protein
VRSGSRAASSLQVSQGEEAVAEQVGERQRHRHEHVGVGLVVDHLPDVGRRPLLEELIGVLEELIGGQVDLVVRRERGVEGVEVVGEQLPGLPVGVLGREVERVRDPVEDERVADHDEPSGRWVAR